MSERVRAGASGICIVLLLDSLAWGLALRTHLGEIVPSAASVPLLFLAIGLTSAGRRRDHGAALVLPAGIVAFLAGTTGPGTGESFAFVGKLLMGALALSGCACLLYGIGRVLTARRPLPSDLLVWMFLGAVAGLSLSLPIKMWAGHEAEAAFACGLFAVIAPPGTVRRGCMALVVLCSLALLGTGHLRLQEAKGRIWERGGLRELVEDGRTGCVRILRNGIEQAYTCKRPTKLETWKTALLRELSNRARRTLLIGEAGPVPTLDASDSVIRTEISTARELLGIPPGYMKGAGYREKHDPERLREEQSEEKRLMGRMPKYDLIVLDGLGNGVTRVPGNPFLDENFLMTPYAIKMMVQGSLADGGLLVALTYGDRPHASAALVEGTEKNALLKIYGEEFDGEDGESTNALVSLLSRPDGALDRYEKRLREAGLLQGEPIAAGPRSGNWFLESSSGSIPRAGSARAKVSEVENIVVPVSPIAMRLAEENPFPLDLLPRFLFVNLPLVLCMVLVTGWGAKRGSETDDPDRGRSVMVGALAAWSFLLLPMTPGRWFFWEPAEGAHLLWELFFATAALGLIVSSRIGATTKRLFSAAFGILLLCSGGTIERTVGEVGGLAFGCLAGFLATVQARTESAEKLERALLAGVPIGVLSYEIIAPLLGVTRITVILFLAYLLILTLWPTRTNKLEPARSP